MRPTYAALTANLIRRGVTTRRTRIIGPDGEFLTVNVAVEGPTGAAEDRCRACGQVFLPLLTVT